ncbi:uncharacterized protein BO95DRAFT_460244 [Aspergillus brunneoviolaceus CBS 621.78]|uniref:Uncharacterized protein n=1 Tax=Aspergillus brunneoviolaceus CBS 621.78 TaxID=1450534 RepID=A0ACD1GJ06_9EURO|nr:hypothetical protein BO95DRAFT_460244 [Aspergillus brunneoviolaceus CBS 621.78]RAH49208.1 hypothetical protein BO95DRAFT_460244 [Aspergillus brunneoviolaceus CBS 621.78]
MGVSNPVKYVLGLSLFTKRPDQRSPAAAAVWKGKAIDHHGQQQHHHHHQEIRWGGAVQGPDDDEEFVAAALHMAVSESDGSRCSGSSSRNSSDSSGSNSSSSNSIRNPHKRHYGVVRVVSWASLVGERCRWTIRQERELAIAEHELARCQKAWSSEQELWLTQIKALHEEKEAHEEFLHHRAKQQDEEQQHFRKSWNRRRSHEEPSQHPTPPHPQPPQRMASTHRANSKLRRGIRRMGS